MQKSINLHRYAGHLYARCYCNSASKKTAAESWLTGLEQTIDATPSKYCRISREQIESLHTYGYVIVPRASSQSIDELEKANLLVLDLLKTSQRSISYRIWRFFNSVDTSQERHSLPLPLCRLLLSVLTKTVQSLEPVLRSMLENDAHLVELSSIISLPGAKRQSTHSDTPFSKQHIIISGFLALTNVNVENGPTCVFGGTHTEAFHRRVPSKNRSNTTHYSSDGSMVDSYGNYDDEKTPIIETAEETQQVSLAMETKEIRAMLQIGDILLFNTKLFHYGSANTSSLPRALMMFSFQNTTYSDAEDRVNGFTYHLHYTVKGKYRLQDFCNTHETF